MAAGMYSSTSADPQPNQVRTTRLPRQVGGHRWGLGHARVSVDRSGLAHLGAALPWLLELRETSKPALDQDLRILPTSLHGSSPPSRFCPSHTQPQSCQVASALAPGSLGPTSPTPQTPPSHQLTCPTSIRADLRVHLPTVCPRLRGQRLLFTPLQDTSHPRWRRFSS